MSRATWKLKYWSVPPNSTSAFDGNRIVRLEQRVEKLHHRDCLTAPVARGEVVAVEHAVHGVLGAEAHHVFQGKILEPGSLPGNLDLVYVHDLAHLVEVGLGIGLHFLGAEHLARGGASRRIADAGGPIADNYDHAVPQLLELPDFAETDCMAQVQIGPAGVHAELDAQRFVRPQHSLQISAYQRVHHTPV